LGYIGVEARDMIKPYRRMFLRANLNEVK